MGEARPAGGQAPATTDVAARPWRAFLPAWAVAGVLLALFSVALVWLSVLTRQPGNGIIALVIGVPSGAVGVVVARRQPTNPLGWVLVAIAACLILSSVGGDYAVLRVPARASTVRWAWRDCCSISCGSPA